MSQLLRLLISLLHLNAGVIYNRDQIFRRKAHVDMLVHFFIKRGDSA